jgi:hypothetical protein
MDACPISLDPLEVIGYADVLPDGQGPAVRPPVYCDRTQPDLCYLPPFRLVGGWVFGAQAVRRAEVESRARAGELTLLPGASFAAQPDCWLWVDLAGEVHYEPVVMARRKLEAFSREQQAAVRAALRAGKLPEAERAAGLAVAADGALEARALQAVCCALRGKDAQLAFLRKSAGQAGFQAETFNLLVQREIEAFPWEVWQDLDMDNAYRACKSNGISFRVEFPIRADVRPYVLGVVHHEPVYGEITIRCQGPDAQFMKTFIPLLGAREVHAFRGVQAVSAVQSIFRSKQLRSACVTTPHRDSLQYYYGHLLHPLVQQIEDEPLAALHTNMCAVSTTPSRPAMI